MIKAAAAAAAADGGGSAGSGRAGGVGGVTVLSRPEFLHNFRHQQYDIYPSRSFPQTQRVHVAIWYILGP